MVNWLLATYSLFPITYSLIWRGIVVHLAASCDRFAARASPSGNLTASRQAHLTIAPHELRSDGAHAIACVSRFFYDGVGAVAFIHIHLSKIKAPIGATLTGLGLGRVPDSVTLSARNHMPPHKQSAKGRVTATPPIAKCRFQPLFSGLKKFSSFFSLQ